MKRISPFAPPAPSWRAREQTLASTVLFALLSACSAGCNRSAPEEPAKPAIPDAGYLHAASLAQAMGLQQTEKPPPPGPPTDADFVKLGSREPDWDLDPTDPAKDYVERYVQATQRYPNERTCVHAQASRLENGRTMVDTRDSTENGCKGTNAVRDTFAVDVEHDRLELADPDRGAPLKDWPDGSSVDGMPAPAPREGPPVDKWMSPIPKALKRLALVPLRVQFYGRGSYPLVSVAGWHGKMTLTSSPAELSEDAASICRASAGFPIGIISQADRSTVLRIKCPAATRWEHL